MDTTTPALDSLTAAEDALIAYAHGDGEYGEMPSTAAPELLRVYCNAAEAFTAGLAALRGLPAAQVAWLTGRQRSMAYGWETRLGTTAGSHGIRLRRAWTDALDALGNSPEPAQEESLRGWLRALDHTLSAHTATLARAEFGDDAPVAGWLDDRAAGAMH